MSEGEEDDHHFEYYFDNERGIDFKFVAGSRSNEKEDERRRLVQHGQARMKEFRYLQPDDLFDPEADDDDDRWVWQQVFKGDVKAKGKKAHARSSDALLSCPCCFATVCIDCVKHDEGSNQWRAIDVLNCVTDGSRLFEYREPAGPRVAGRPANRTQQRGGGPKKGQRRTAADDSSNEEDDDDDDEDEEGGAALHLHPSNPLHEVPPAAAVGMAPEDLYRTVHCEGCGVQVGVVDLNGIYHLYSVVPSNA
eukprot:EG_transcript_24036